METENNIVNNEEEETKKEAEQLCAKIALDQFKFNWRLIIDSNKELFDCAKDGYIEVTDWDYL